MISLPPARVADLTGELTSERAGARRRWWVLVAVPVVVVVAVVLPLLTAGPAAALGTASPAGMLGADGGGSNPWLSFFQPQDSHKLSPWAYELSIDQGGVTDTGKAVSAYFAQQCWMFYRFFVVAVMWLLDFVLQFKQLDLLRTPAEALSQTIQSVTGQIGIVPLLAVLSVVVSGVWLFRGRSGAAFGEILSTVIITALIGTTAANPMGLIAGQDGALAYARDFGVAVSSQMLSPNATPTTPEAMRAHVDAAVLDNLIRTPHQLINYGKVLDRQGSPACVSAYDHSLGVQDIAGARDKVGAACGEETHAASDNTMAVALGVAVVGTAGGFFLVVVLILAICLLVFTGIALWEAAKFIVEMVKSILPGSGRTGMFVSAATMAVCVCLCAVTLMAVGILLLVLQDVFVATSSWPPVTVFLFVDLVLISAAVASAALVVKAKKSGRKLGEGMGKALTPRPGSLPAGGGLKGAARQLAQPALQLRQQAQLRHNLNGPPTGRPGPLATSPAGTARMARPAAGTPVPHTNPSILRTVGKVAVGAGKIGLASTVGAPVYAPRAAAAARKAMAARKTVMATRLAAARSHAVTRVGAARDDVSSFGAEYAHNVGVAGRFAAKMTGLPQLLQAVSSGNPDLVSSPGTLTAGAHPLRPMKDVAVELPPPGSGRKKPPPPASAAPYRPSDHQGPQPSPRVSQAGTGTPPPPPLPSPITRPQSAAERLRARLDRH